MTWSRRLGVLAGLLLLVPRVQAAPSGTLNDRDLQTDYALGRMIIQENTLPPTGEALLLPNGGVAQSVPLDPLLDTGSANIGSPSLITSDFNIPSPEPTPGPTPEPNPFVRRLDFPLPIQRPELGSAVPAPAPQSLAEPASQSLEAIQSEVELLRRPEVKFTTPEPFRAADKIDPLSHDDVQGGKSKLPTAISTEEPLSPPSSDSKSE